MKYRFSQHLPNKKHMVRHFWAMSVLSVVAVFCVALLSRAELRLSGELLAAGDGDDLALLMELGAFDRVELVRSTAELKLYLLHGENYDYLAHVVLQEGEWIVEKIETVH